MLELKTKKELAQYAFTLASSFNLVRYRNTTYIPQDYESLESDPLPSGDRTIWMPLSRDALRERAAGQFQALFGTDGELSSFEFMVAQNAQAERSTTKTLLIKTSEGLRELRPDGELHLPSGAFVANTVLPMLNTDEKDKERILSTIREWVDSEEEAASLLSHLATCLSPGWSAVKYVLLLGEGRNGKSLLMKMMQALFGQANVSNITRQLISEQNPVVTDLNGKLINIVFDGRAEYLRDSATEKSLVAGEPVPIRKLYESAPTIVQTNALFVEGLNREPKSNDKSTALQKRMVRFQFPNIYALDHKFERQMLDEKSLGAFLSLLIDHFVLEDEVAERLAPTARAVQLQLEHMYVNSIALQYLAYLDENDPTGVLGILGDPMPDLVKRFQSWRVKENDLGTWAEPDVMALFQPLLNTERRSMRVDGAPRKVRVITSLKPEATAFLESLKGDDIDDDEILVAD